VGEQVGVVEVAEYRGHAGGGETVGVLGAAGQPADGVPVAREAGGDGAAEGSRWRR
jgi:hypothetical protein